MSAVKRQLALFLYKVEFVMFIEVHGRSFDFVMNFMFQCLHNGSMCGLQSDAGRNVASIKYQKILRTVGYIGHGHV